MALLRLPAGGCCVLWVLLQRGLRWPQLCQAAVLRGIRAAGLQIGTDWQQWCLGGCCNANLGDAFWAVVALTPMVAACVGANALCCHCLNWFLKVV